MCIMPQRLFRHYVEIFPGNQCRQREHTAAQTFTDHEHVGDDTVVLTSEHLSGTAEGVWNLVQDQ